jgi:hypothetical protein
MAALEVELGQVRVVLQLAALDENLLAFGLDAGQREDLVFEYFAGGARVEFDVVLLPLVLDDNWEPVSSCNGRAADSPGIGSMAGDGGARETDYVDGAEM